MEMQKKSYLKYVSVVRIKIHRISTIFQAMTQTNFISIELPPRLLFLR